MTLQVHLMSNDAHHWKLCPESIENWGNSDLVTSPSLGILRVRLFPSCSSWFTFDANTLFFSHNTLCTSVALLLPPISGPDLFGPMAFWIIVQFVGIYHKPKRIQNSEVSLLSRCHLSVHLRLMNLSTSVYIPLLFCMYPSLHPIVCVCVCACLLLPLLCAGESKAERDESQAGHEGWYRSLTESTTEQSQRHGR